MEPWHDAAVTARTYTDRCPGVFRPWLAADGAIVRLRTPGGTVTPAAVRSLVDVAERHGDGTVLLTSRANLQVRGLPVIEGHLPDDVLIDLRRTGLLPSNSHELVRNIVSSPLSGRIGGLADLRPVVTALDFAICAEPALADFGGRFLFVLDDGRGDVVERDADLGCVVVTSNEAQLRMGDGWGAIVALEDVPSALMGLARQFGAARGVGASACWHVSELPDPRVVGPRADRDARTRKGSEPPAPGRYPQDDGRSLEVVDVVDGVVTRSVAERLLDFGSTELVATPWRSVVVPDLEV